METLKESELRWRIEGPGLDRGTDADRSDGSQGFGRSVAPAFDLVRGQYTISVDGANNETGDYSSQ